MIIGYRTPGELEEQPGDGSLFSPPGRPGSVLRKAAGRSRSGMENEQQERVKIRMQALELDILGSNFRFILGREGDP